MNTRRSKCINLKAKKERSSRTLKLIGTSPFGSLCLRLCLGRPLPLKQFGSLKCHFYFTFSAAVCFHILRLPLYRLSFLSISLSSIAFSWLFFSSLTFLPPQKNEGDLFHRLWHVMNEILDLRRQVLVGHLTHDRMRDVKQHITARLDWGNEWVNGGQTERGTVFFSNVQIWLW